MKINPFQQPIQHAAPPRASTSTPEEAAPSETLQLSDQAAEVKPAGGGWWRGLAVAGMLALGATAALAPPAMAQTVQCETQAAMPFQLVKAKDGTVVILVRGEQILDVPGKGQQARAVNVEYLVKNTAEGLRIAGISESNS